MDGPLGEALWAFVFFVLVSVLVSKTWSKQKLNIGQSGCYDYVSIVFVHVLATFCSLLQLKMDGTQRDKQESCSRYLPLFWPVRKLGAAVEHNLSLSQSTPMSIYLWWHRKLSFQFQFFLQKRNIAWDFNKFGQEPVWLRFNYNLVMSHCVMAMFCTFLTQLMLERLDSNQSQSQIFCFIKIVH